MNDGQRAANRARETGSQPNEPVTERALWIFGRPRVDRDKDSAT
jgi:hypothetical protein